jgi:hypothetical protein
MAQNSIKKSPISALGYGFITANQIPKGKNEYYLRNIQNRSGIAYRQLTAYEIEVLVRNRNTSDNWNHLLVSDAFNAELVKNCKFYGLVRIGKLEPFCLEFSDLKVPVGLYNSTIISCDLGDNVSIDNVNYLSHYILGNEVIINNVNELVTTNHAKFGVGIIKKEEAEAVRIWMEICNENGGRSVLPFNGMLPGDAFLWSKYRDDASLLQKFKEFTEARFNDLRGYYGKVGDRTVIKNTAIIKDVWIGEDAYIKGANKLKNLTINSGSEGTTQIGEGCEIVNGIIGFGCRIFYGVKAVRFIMASHSQLKYGARLINSYLGNNATISCCEVLNTLIFPAHEQHHNNSFLCAALVMGQSNIAAGATIGSNHNSRAADGEIVAGRGFWPGLCVSLKHNSKFASFTILAKGDYPAELNIPLPFSLVSNDVSKDELVIIPCYWLMYNMYALARNSWKYVDRDKRIERIQHIEYNYLAPDTINEIFAALPILEEAVGRNFLQKNNPAIKLSKEQCIEEGKNLLDSPTTNWSSFEVNVSSFENSKRNTKLLKADKAYQLYKELVHYYFTTTMLELVQETKFDNWNDLIKKYTSKAKRNEWLNIGGQLMPLDIVNTLKEKIKKGTIKSWDAVHDFYSQQSTLYKTQKVHHAIGAILELNQISAKQLDETFFNKILTEAVNTKTWMSQSIYQTRSKDYNSDFRKMVYDTQEEMEQVMGKLEDNGFIQQEIEDLKVFKQKVNKLRKQFRLNK